MRSLVCIVLITAVGVAGCGVFATQIGEDECIVIPGAGAVGCAAAEGMVLDSSGRPMPAVYLYFGGSLTPGRVGGGYGELRGDNHITDGAGHYRMRTVLQGAFATAIPDTATVWIVAARIDTLSSGTTIQGPRDSVAALLRFGPAGPTTPRNQVPPITLPDR